MFFIHNLLFILFIVTYSYILSICFYFLNCPFLVIFVVDICKYTNKIHKHLLVMSNPAEAQKGYMRAIEEYMNHHD